jgi:hypothetical protein
LERSKGMDAGKIAAARQELANAENGSKAERQETLARLVAQLDAAVNGAGDASKVRTLASVVRELGANQLAGR